MSNNTKATGSFVYPSTTVDFQEPPKTEVRESTPVQEPTVDNSQYIRIFEGITGSAVPEKCRNCAGFEVCGLLTLMGI